jgi:uncharacterized protein YecE (DUF72 family)
MRFFYDAMALLKDKTAAILVQLPGSIVFKEGYRKLKNLPFDERFRHAIEIRHITWFDDDFYDFQRANNICLVWSQRDEIQRPLRSRLTLLTCALSAIEASKTATWGNSKRQSKRDAAMS